MFTREIVCMYCGKAGKVEVPGREEDLDSSLLFRFLGHNPFSGHMHFRCPACSIVLLVEPMAMLSVGGLLKGSPDRSRWDADERSVLNDLSKGVAWLRHFLLPAEPSH